MPVFQIKRLDGIYDPRIEIGEDVHVRLSSSFETVRTVNFEVTCQLDLFLSR